jgi:hypothetical protein
VGRASQPMAWHWSQVRQLAGIIQPASCSFQRPVNNSQCPTNLPVTERAHYHAAAPSCQTPCVPAYGDRLNALASQQQRIRTNSTSCCTMNDPHDTLSTFMGWQQPVQASQVIMHSLAAGITHGICRSAGCSYRNPVGALFKHMHACNQQPMPKQPPLKQLQMAHHLSLSQQLHVPGQIIYTLALAQGTTCWRCSRCRGRTAAPRQGVCPTCLCTALQS